MTQRSEHTGNSVRPGKVKLTGPKAQNTTKWQRTKIGSVQSVKSTCLTESNCILTMYSRWQTEGQTGLKTYSTSTKCVISTYTWT